MQQGSTGNVIAALASFFIPGLGQPLRDRALACFEAAVYKGKISNRL